MIRPLFNRVIVKPVENESQGASPFLHIPDNAKEKPQEGEVVAVGKEATKEIRIKDRVLFGKYSGTDVKIGDEDLLILRDEEILAVL